MKSEILVSLLPLLASASVLSPRQLFGLGASAPVAKIVQVKPQVRDEAKRQITYFGPYTLRANDGKHSGGSGMMSMGMGEDANGQNMMLSMSNGFPRDVTVLAGKVGLAFMDLSEADEKKGVYIHHVITQDVSKTASPFITFCDSKTANPSLSMSDRLMGGLGAGFLGTGDDNKNMQTYYTTPDGKFNAGFYLGKADRMVANAMLVNYNPEPKQVYVTYEMEYVPGKVGVDTQTSLLTVTGCMSRAIKLSKTEATNTTSEKFTFLQDGNLLSAKGHIHDGGSAMHLSINDKYVCSSRATYGAPVAGGTTATITGMSACAGPIAVKKGDYLTMISEYDLPKHPLRESTSGGEAGTMGMWRVLFAPLK